MSDRNETAAVPHVPVMVEEVLCALAPVDGDTIIDGTFGAGGYSTAILCHAGCTVVGIDRDPGAIALGAPLRERFGDRLILLEGRFADMEELVRVVGISQVNAVVLDLGVSSMQIDEAERGFSFMRDGPLDMRMDRGATGTPSAADVINTSSETEIANVLYRLGEERASRRIARAIVEARRSQPILRTRQLADLVEITIGRRPGRDKIHPATRTFQALRILVNRELEQLAAGLAAAERLLSEGGRLVVVSFHSLEDRIVKSFLTERSGRRARPSRHLPDPGDAAPQGSFSVATGGARKPGRREIETNPRARSARLRSAVRTAANPIPLTLKGLGVPVFDQE